MTALSANAVATPPRRRPARRRSAARGPGPDRGGGPVEAGGLRSVGRDRRRGLWAPGHAGEVGWCVVSPTGRGTCGLPDMPGKSAGVSPTGRGTCGLPDMPGKSAGVSPTGRGVCGLPGMPGKSAGVSPDRAGTGVPGRSYLVSPCASAELAGTRIALTIRASAPRRARRRKLTGEVLMASTLLRGGRATPPIPVEAA